MKAAAVARDINPVNAPNDQGILEPARLALLTSKYWGSGGTRLTVGFLDNPEPELRTRILSHMNAWGAFCNVSFTEVQGPAQVRIARTAGDGYWSYLGTDILQIPANEPTMNLQSFSMRTRDSEFYRVVRHETGHTLGFHHEHLRSEIIERIDQEKAIDWAKRVQGWDEPTTVSNILTPITPADIIATASADRVSVMCYSLPAEIMKDGVAVPGGTDIDAEDALLASKIYPKLTPSPYWVLLDQNPAEAEIAASGDQLYKRHNNGEIWTYAGTPFTGWKLLDNNHDSIKIVADKDGDNDKLYQLRKTGKVLVYTGKPLIGWQQLDANSETVDIVASGGHLYKHHKDGSIWTYTGTPNSGWKLLDNNPDTAKIVADTNSLYQLHKTGRIFVHSGTPLNAWTQLDANTATVEIAASGGHL